MVPLRCTRFCSVALGVAVVVAIDLATGVVTHRGQSKASDDLVLGLLALGGIAMLFLLAYWYGEGMRHAL